MNLKIHTFLGKNDSLIYIESEELFRLSSGIAGDVLQKFSNYSICY